MRLRPPRSLVIGLAARIASSGVSAASAVDTLEGAEVPAFLDCEGPRFDPLWASFRRAAIENVKQGYPKDLSLREAAAGIIHRFEARLHDGTRAWVVHLRTAASGDIYRFRPSRPESAPPVGRNGGADAFFERAAGTLSSSGMVSESNASDSDPMSFCLYGYIQALFIEYGYAYVLEEALGHSAVLEEDVCIARLGLLLVAEQLLGGETHEVDFLDSSSWPVNSFDLHLSLHPPAGQWRVAKAGCLRLFDATMLPPAPVSGLRLETWAGIPVTSVAATNDLVRLVGLGLHVASTLEPVAALRRAAEALGASSIVAYYGHPCYGDPKDKALKHACEHKCQMFGNPCDDDRVAEVLKGMFNRSGLYEELPWSIHDALGALAAVRASEPTLRGADVMVCSGPLVLCYLLDVLAPETPLVHPICSQLLWGAPSGPGIATMLLAHVRVMASQSTRLLVACNDFAAAQCSHQTGVDLVVVPRIALYLPEGSKWMANQPGGRWKEALILRSRYWHRLPGQYFMDILESFLRVNEHRYNLTLTMASSFRPDELPPPEIAKYRAVVLIPNDVTVFSFVEMYMMGVPTFVPTAEWLFRLRRSVPFGFFQPAEALPALSGRLAASMNGTRLPPSGPPFMQESGHVHPGDALNFAHWQRASELHSYPNVPHFDSIPQLVHGIAMTDLAAVSASISLHADKLRHHAIHAWSEALAQLVPQASSAATVGSGIATQSHGNEENARARSSFRPRIDVGVGTSSGLEFLDCISAGYSGLWTSFRRAFTQSSQGGFPLDEALRDQAVALWQGVKDAAEGTLQLAAALFHQVLAGHADPSFLAMGDHCHYGMVAALFTLGRHCLPDAVASNQALVGDMCKTDFSGLALKLLGEASALDFLEDSAWRLSAADVAALILAESGDGSGSLNFSLRRPKHAANEAQHLVVWRHGRPLPPLRADVAQRVLARTWRTAVVGAHPSLSADIAEAVHQALDKRTHVQFFGLSCPEHSAASHHCKFRCEMLGLCQDDAIFTHILGQMLDWAQFTERPYDISVVARDLHGIVEISPHLRDAELLVCTGPFVLCWLLRPLIFAPMLVYFGLTLTYLADVGAVQGLLEGVRAAAALPGFHRLEDLGAHPDFDAACHSAAALVVTDVVRAAQLRYSTGVWATVVPPLSLYSRPVDRAVPAAAVPPHDRRAVVLRPELWRRAAFGPALRSLLQRFSKGAMDFQESFLPWGQMLEYDAAVLLPWDNDVMSFYELYHAGMPLLVPEPRLMVKWLPSVRWGSLEPTELTALRLAGLPSLDSLPPWVEQRTLPGAIAEGALEWIEACDYYTFPHVLHFASAAGAVAALHSFDASSLRTSLVTAGARLRLEALGFYRVLLTELLSAPSAPWQRLPGVGTCKSGFLSQADFDSPEGPATCRHFCWTTDGCEVATFNGHCCMLYGPSENGVGTCDERRSDGDRSAYIAWRRVSRKSL